LFPVIYCKHLFRIIIQIQKKRVKL